MSVVTFLNELSGDFVRHLRTAPQVTVSGVPVPAISSLVGADNNARIYSEMARHGAPLPQIVYTQAGGHSSKTLAGTDGCEEMTLHVYAYADSPSTSRLLARAVLERTIETDNSVWGVDTNVHVCNGGIVDSGVLAAVDQSDRKLYWTRLVLKLIIS